VYVAAKERVGVHAISPGAPELAAVTRRIGIVGGGPGGLAAAMLLAKAGVDVTVHEARDVLGGRSATITAPSDQGTFRFDTGPTFFLYPRVLQDIFAACGCRLEDEVELIRLDPQYKLMFEDGAEIDATGDMVRMAAQIARLSPTDAAALPAFMADNRAKLAVFRPILEAAFNSIRDLGRPSVLRGLRMLRPHRSVDRDLGVYFRDPRVRLAFSFQSKYLGMSPFRCPSLFTILSFMEYEYGVYHPRGGTGAVIAAMARVARRLGARIDVGQPVQEILFEGRRAVGLRAGGVERRYDALVINADFAHTMTKLVPDGLRRRWSDRKIAGKKFSCSTFMMYLGLEGTNPELAHHTIYLARDYAKNLREIEAGQAPGEPSFYVQNACVTDPALAPPGHSTLYVLVPVGHRAGEGVDWPAEQARYRALTLKRLERIGLRDVERRIRFEKILTPQGWEQDLQVFRGATFNLSHNIGQMLHWRPRNRFEDLEGVYLVGGGTHPGSGLPVIFESARITSRLLTEDFGISPDWNPASAMAADHYVPAVAEAL
jgi:phytoene desaturase